MRGETIKSLAKRFKVGVATIVYWTNENYREYDLKRGRERIVKYNSEKWKERRAYLLKVNPKLRIYYATKYLEYLKSKF